MVFPCLGTGLTGCRLVLSSLSLPPWTQRPLRCCEQLRLLVFLAIPQRHTRADDCHRHGVNPKLSRSRLTGASHPADGSFQHASKKGYLIRLRKCHAPWQPEADAEHQLRRRHVPHFMEARLPLNLPIALLEEHTNLLLYPLQHTLH